MVRLTKSESSVSSALELDGATPRVPGSGATHWRLPRGEFCLRAAGAIHTMQAATTLPRELTVEDLALETSDPIRTVQRRVQQWHARQHVDPTLPRVRRARAPGADRWRYLIDADSYAAWHEGRRAPGSTPPLGAPGCSCQRGTGPNGQVLGVISSECAVHRGLLG